MLSTTSLAAGAPLNAETWADFVARLHHDCVGEGVREHCTADATFLVEKRVWHAVPEDHSDTLRVYTDGHDEALEAFLAGLDAEQLAALDQAVEGAFSEADSYDMAQAMAKLHPESTLYHAMERWEFVCQHFTQGAADEFIKRKKHDYPDGLRVYVDATSYSWELNAIKAAILSGRIGLLPEAAAQAAAKGEHGQ